jgi:hypothetical protein
LLLVARREGLASSLRLRRLRDAKRRSQPPTLRFEEESQPEEDQ